MRENVRMILMQYADPKYKEFSTGLIPGAKPLVGVRLPQLRKIAKDIVKKGIDESETDWSSEIDSYDGEYMDIYFEETMLRGMIIGYGTAQKAFPFEKGLDYLEKFIPHIDNWSVCDSFCNSFCFANRHRDAVWDFMQSYLYSDKEYEVRAALILLLSQYLKYDADNKKISRNRTVGMSDLQESPANKERSANTKVQYPYLEKILGALDREFSQGYYAQMAAAWLMAEAFVCFPYETNQALAGGCKLDTWTYNKAIQKICESLNPDQDVKKYVKSLKR